MENANTAGRWSSGYFNAPGATRVQRHNRIVINGKQIAYITQLKPSIMKKFDAFIDAENETRYIGLYAKKAYAEKKAKARGYDPAGVYYVERR